MVDKMKELKKLEDKYNEMEQLNSEINLVIKSLKKSAEINRENELLKEKAELEKKLVEITENLKKKEKELENFKNKNSILIEELKDAKRAKTNNEINKFQIFVADKVNVELEKGINKKLSDYSKTMSEKIKMTEKVLENDFSENAKVLKKELEDLNVKIAKFVEESSEKTETQKQFLLENSSVFHNKIREEAKMKENEFLFEKEKTRFVYEKFIGLKGFNFLGIISIFLGVFLIFRTQFVKIFSNNYVKSAGAYLLGMAFLFVGERFYQKNKKQFAVGLIGGGIGILYLTTLLSTIRLKLFPMPVGLLISIILTALVVVLSLRYDNQVIGILSLIGGYLPYGAYIWINKSNVQIYYLIVYSLILQGTVLGISWKKDWIVNKIIGFVIGSFNMIGLVYYLNNKLNKDIVAFVYILIFTTAYTFIFLNSYKKENRKINFIDYFLVSLNLIVKFSLIYSLFDKNTPSIVKTILVGGVGIIYGFFGEKLKENRISKIFNIVALGSFILIIPLIVPKNLVVLAWGMEAILLYYLYKKYESKELKYGFLAIYCVAFLSGFLIREANYFLGNLQDFMNVSLSFVVYFMLREKIYHGILKVLLGVFKYIIFIYSMNFVSNLFSDIVWDLKIKILEDSISLINNAVMLIIPVIIYLLREVTYKMKKLNDKFSLKFLVIMEIVYLMFINLCNNFLFIADTEPYQKTLGDIVGIIILIITNIYLFAATRTDFHFLIFKKPEKHHFWILGEMIYILLVSNVIMDNLNLVGAGLYLSILGLLICGYLVWKGFKTPNKNVRRIGLGIGIVFVFKSFFVDFMKFDSSFRLVAYFVMGAILIGTSYIYQSALKNLDKVLKEEVEKNSEKEKIK